MISEPPDNYVHGHGEAVLRSHASRTAANSAAYLLPHLRQGQSLLDVGCGPGTITIDLATRLAPGQVVGIDPSSDVIATANARLVDGAVDNCTFRVDDVYELDVPDAGFDVTHAHQVLQHLTDPVRALAEMRRVTRPGGIVAARDADYGAFVWTPADPRLDRWLDVYHHITTANGVEADAGRHLPGWFRAAGFTDIEITASCWVFADPPSREWWGTMWADRVLQSTYADQALGHGIATSDDLAAIADGFRAWAAHPDGAFLVPQGEVVARA